MKVFQPVIWSIFIFVGLSFVLPVGCQTQVTGGNEPLSQTDGGEQVKDSTAAKPDPTEAAFASAQVLKISITMDPKDWDLVRQEARNYDNFLAPSCLQKPFGSNFTYRKATVRIDGVVFKNVGIRKKGFVGSIDDNKPSLKLKFDKFTEGQKFSGLERMTLNNNKSDPAFMKQCITYSLFLKAGLPAPRCNFAHVTINGKTLGVFSHVESVKKRFLKRHFKDNSGALYEGTLSDFREGWTNTLEIKTNTKDTGRSAIEGLTAALKEPDNKLVAALSKWLDVDQFIRFWAMETLVNHLDGYAGNTNNFFVYHDPTTQKLVFLPWGVDATLLNLNRSPRGAPKHILAKGMLARRLYQNPDTQKKFVAELKKLMDTVWNESELNQEVNRIEAMIEPYVGGDHFFQLRSKGKSLSSQIAPLRKFIDGRKGELQPVLDKPPAWNVPLSKPICFRIIAAGKGSFTTTFGTLKEPDVFKAGKGTFSGSFQGKPYEPNMIGVSAGVEARSPERLSVNVVMQLSPSDFLIVHINLPKSQLVVGRPIPLPNLFRGGRSGLALHNTISRVTRTIGATWEGTVTFTKLGLQSKEPIEGTFEGRWIEFSDPNQDPGLVCYDACMRAKRSELICKGVADSFRACLGKGTDPKTCFQSCTQ